MYFEDINFLNFPAIRFKRSSMKNLDDFCDAVYKKFKTDEEEGEKWKDECYDALVKDDKDRIKELEKKGQITFVGDAIDILLDKFSMETPISDEEFEGYKETILKCKAIKDLEYKKNPIQIVFKTTIGDFKASKLTDIFSKFKLIPGIETRERHGCCHSASIDVSTTVSNKNKVATGYYYTFGEGAKYLHSWVEVKLGNVPFVIDTTRNLLMPKKGYYFVRNIEGPVYKISSGTLKREKHIRDCLLEENEWLNKLYLSNRHQAKQVYKLIMKQKSEKSDFQDAKEKEEC